MSIASIPCPCCRRHVDHRRIRQTFALFPFDGMMSTASAGPEATFLEVLRRYPGFYQWACDDCLDNGRALRADPRKQFYTFKYPWDTAQPFFAYFDRNRTCEACGEEFVFTKEEQQYWYEQLQFVVYSVPNQCPACRKERRQKRNLNRELSELLRAGVPGQIDQLRRIAAIYAAMGKPEKEKAYLAEVRKLGG
jgi:hypothetical protein